ncbi:MAG: Rpn family recombination-promoting nuclease/putative transposase [Thermoanaerobaculia bacterium]|nr:Rpn family recombination-promoting nuclease/putative transposase [Thermoanaerobaculia bacterium]
MTRRVHNADDRSFRLLFQHPEVVADLLRGLIHEPWVEDLDLGTLEKLPSDYLSGALPGPYEERTGDVVWRVSWRNRRQGLFLILMLELQSTRDPAMALRILVYLVLFYQRLLKLEPTLLSDGGKLPPVCPIVFYNGDEDWGSVLEMRELIGPVSESLAPHIPSLRYCLIDVKRLPLKELEGVENVAAAICRVERGDGPESLARVVGELAEWLKEPESRELRRDFVAWLTKVVLPEQLGGAPFPRVTELDEFKTVLEGNMQTWSERWFSQGRLTGREEGREEGRVAERADSLLWFLRYKFGELDPGVVVRVQTADAATLLRWRERLPNARSLEDVFGA